MKDFYIHWGSVICPLQSRYKVIVKSLSTLSTHLLYKYPHNSEPHVINNEFSRSLLLAGNPAWFSNFQGSKISENNLQNLSTFKINFVFDIDTLNFNSQCPIFN